MSMSKGHETWRVGRSPNQDSAGNEKVLIGGGISKVPLAVSWRQRKRSKCSVSWLQHRITSLSALSRSWENIGICRLRAPQSRGRQSAVATRHDTLYQERSLRFPNSCDFAHILASGDDIVTPLKVRTQRFHASFLNKIPVIDWDPSVLAMWPASPPFCS
jgi:hypothetical protein